jgi:trimethylamine:corrinoid methyltransferase-like protein
MKEIIYKGKKVKVPFEDANYTLDGDKDVTIENRFGGEKATVPGYAAAVYDVIIGAESFQDWDRHRKGLDWFSRNFPKQYMVLLD